MFFQDHGHGLASGNPAISTLTVAEIDADRVKELYGGGDWHMAYMCLFRKMETTSL